MAGPGGWQTQKPAAPGGWQAQKPTLQAKPLASGQKSVFPAYSGGASTDGGWRTGAGGSMAPTSRRGLGQVMDQQQAWGSAGLSPAPAGEGFGPGFGETYGKQHIGQYDQPTMLETFAQQQLDGNNPYYARLRQQGMDALNQQMAARGHYNSGGAMSALGNYGAAVDAAQFQNMGQLLGSASQMGLGRMGQGQNVANQIQGLQQGRMGQQFGQLSDLAHLGAGLTGGFFGMGGQLSGDAAMAGINAGANASQLTGLGQQQLPNMVMGGINAKLGKGG